MALYCPLWLCCLSTSNTTMLTNRARRKGRFSCHVGGVKKFTDFVLRADIETAGYRDQHTPFCCTSQVNTQRKPPALARASFSCRAHRDPHLELRRTTIVLLPTFTRNLQLPSSCAGGRGDCHGLWAGDPSGPVCGVPRRFLDGGGGSGHVPLVCVAPSSQRGGVSKAYVRSCIVVGDGHSRWLFFWSSLPLLYVCIVNSVPTGTRTKWG